MSDNEKRIDQILREMDQVNIEEAKNKANSFVEKAKETINPFSYFWVQFTSSALLIWNKYLKPVWDVIYWLGVGLVWKQFRRIWDRFAFVEKDGKRVFSRLSSGTRRCILQLHESTRLCICQTRRRSTQTKTSSQFRGARSHRHLARTFPALLTRVSTSVSVLPALLRSGASFLKEACSILTTCRRPSRLVGRNA